MARKETNKIKLKLVDDKIAQTGEVVRLDNAETESFPMRMIPIRLDQDDAALQPSRLNIPDKKELELRTHQPDIETLMDTAVVNAGSMENDWGETVEKRKPIPWGWFALLGLIITGAIFWSLANIEKSKPQVRRFKIEAETMLDNQQREELEASNEIKKIEQAIYQFFSATDAESLAQNARHPDRVLPLIRAHQVAHPIKPTEVKAIKSLQPITMGNRATFWIGTVAFDGGLVRDLIIEFDQSGVPRVDWETLVCAQPMPWDQFARERPSAKFLDFRVYAEEDNLFSHEFSAPGAWLCFRLTSLNSEEFLFGYIPANSADALKIRHEIAKNRGMITSLILRLIIPEQLKSPRGVVIEQVLNDRWIYIDPPVHEP